MAAIYRGIAAADGIAIGNAVVVRKERYVPEAVPADNPERELERLESALQAAKVEIESIRLMALDKLGSEKAEIFEGHLIILDDPDLKESVESAIANDRCNAEYALHAAASGFVQMLLELEDEALRSRAADVQDIASRVMSHLRGEQHVDLTALHEKGIIVAYDMSPSDTAQLDLDYTLGFITEAGSRTSHSAIMARTLDIPAVVGAGPGLANIRHGDLLVVDAEQGEIAVNPDERELARYRERKEAFDERRRQLRRLAGQPTLSLDGRQVELAANVGKLEDVEAAIRNGAEGIGLFRTEFLYMSRSALPDEEEQFNSYKYALEKMNGKPVVIRTLDIGGDKELAYLPLPKEDNPFLGRRALRFCLANPELFRTQLRALLRASVYGNLKIMFPMVAVMEELAEAKQLLEEEKRRLLDEGTVFSDSIEVGIMVEIPSVALAARAFARQVDFFSIGTNDLIQYTMAADRMNESLSYLYQPLHPSVLRLIKMVIDGANQERKWVGMCGEMAGDAEAVPLLLGLGLHEFSMSAASILPSRALIGSCSQARWKAIADEALDLPDAAAVSRLVQQYMPQR